LRDAVTVEVVPASTADQLRKAKEVNYELGMAQKRRAEAAESERDALQAELEGVRRRVAQVRDDLLRVGHISRHTVPIKGRRHLVGLGEEERCPKCDHPLADHYWRDGGLWCDECDCILPDQPEPKPEPEPQSEGERWWITPHEAQLENGRTTTLMLASGSLVDGPTEVAPASTADSPRRERDEQNRRHVAEREKWIRAYTGANANARAAESQRDALRAELERVKGALSEAADDLGKASNQFESMKRSLAAGHKPAIIRNPDIFAEKERKARAALSPGDG
jgi:septal ring factor EnvC (AmiA/AmiB activator)